jgi:hypothetical protein
MTSSRRRYINFWMSLVEGKEDFTIFTKPYRTAISSVKTPENVQYAVFMFTMCRFAEDINTTCLITKRLRNGHRCKVKMRKMYE